MAVPFWGVELIRGRRLFWSVGQWYSAYYRAATTWSPAFIRGNMHSSIEYSMLKFSDFAVTSNTNIATLEHRYTTVL